MPTEDLEPLAYALHNLFRSTFRVVMAHVHAHVHVVGDVTTSCDVTTCRRPLRRFWDQPQTKPKSRAAAQPKTQNPGRCAAQNPKPGPLTSVTGARGGNGRRLHNIKT